MDTLKRPLKTESTVKSGMQRTDSGSVDSMVAACVSEMMNMATSMHKLHLKVTGTGSYAAHKALKNLYEALPDHADDLAEGYQGATEKLLTYKESSPKSLNTVQEGLAYMRDMCDMICALQEKLPYSELVNDLDTAKSSLNSAKYKLLFLK